MTSFHSSLEKGARPSRLKQQVVVVLEDLYQTHNASSILRTCDAFGVQDLYVIHTRNRFQYDPEKSRGMENFIRCHTFAGPNATSICFSELKQQGYLLAATSLRPGCITVAELPMDRKLALCFGTEERGLSEQAHQLADVFLRIPMYGMTQSFNVSVTVALCLQSLTTRPSSPRTQSHQNPSEAPNWNLN